MSRKYTADQFHRGVNQFHNQLRELTELGLSQDQAVAWTYEPLTDVVNSDFFVDSIAHVCMTLQENRDNPAKFAANVIDSITQAILMGINLREQVALDNIETVLDRLSNPREEPITR